jgi:hypothetical protein
MSQGKLNGTPSSVPMPTSGNASNTLMGQGPLGTTGAAAPQNYQYQFGGSTGAPVIGGMSSMPGQAPQQINLQGQSGAAPTMQNLQDQIAQLTRQLTALQNSGSAAPQAAPSTATNPNMFTTGTGAQPIQNAAGGIIPAMGFNIAPSTGSTQG